MTARQPRTAGHPEGWKDDATGGLEPTDVRIDREVLAREVEAGDPQRTLSRRRFLSGTLAGGVGGLALAAGTGATVWKVADSRAAAALADANDELARVQGLVELYEKLEKVGLDAILQTGLAAVALPLEAVELGAKALKRGLDLGEQALLAAVQALPSAQEAVLWLEDRVADLSSAIGRVEAALGSALKRAADSRIGQALRDFGDMILEKLPFGLGDEIREVIEGLAELLTGIDDLVSSVNDSLLEPLRAKWFSANDNEGIRTLLLEPLIENVLDPLEAHLGGLAALIDTWQDWLLAPSQKALEERRQIREEIARYKRAHGLG